MRARFRRQDGHLYVTGLRGWQTSAAWPGCLQRIRYTASKTERNPLLPIALHVREQEIELTFSTELNVEIAKELSRYRVRQWNYRWTKDYGSKDYSVVDPEKEGRDELPVSTVRMSEDRRSVFLRIPTLAPVMQMMIEFDLVSETGEQLSGPIFSTINEIPGS